MIPAHAVATERANVLSLACVLIAGVSACSAETDPVPVAGSWASLEVGAQEATSFTASVGAGTTAWLEPTDLSTGLEPNRVQLAIGLLSRAGPLDPEEIKMVAGGAELVRWPEQSPVPFRVEFEDDIRKEYVTTAKGTERTKVHVVPTTPLEPGWYALKANRQSLVSRFHIGPCPIVVGIGACDGVDVYGIVFSEPVSKDADVEVLALDEQETCTHDSLGLENRHQDKGVRRYIKCDFDVVRAGARIRVGDVTVQPGRKLVLPAGLEQGGRALLDVVPQNYKKSGRCSFARVPLHAPLPQCL